MHAAAGRAGRREQVRFVSVSQFGAGAFLNAIPTRAHFRLPSYVLRFALQRRFGLHLSMMTDVMADGIYSQHGLPFDALGDVAQNDGAAGHQTRHKEVLLDALSSCCGASWGAARWSTSFTASTALRGRTCTFTRA